MHSLYKQNNLPYLSVKLCPNCKKLVPAKVDICEHCNYNFTSKISAKDLFVDDERALEHVVSKPKQVFEHVESKQVINKTVSNMKVVFCDNCGAKIIGSQKYFRNIPQKICRKCEGKFS